VQWNCSNAWMEAHDTALKQYRAVVTKEFMAGLLSASQLKTRAGLYNYSLVIWLMISQRLSPDQTLRAAIKKLRDEYRDQAEGLKARVGKISPSTGGYAQARQRIEFEVVEKVADQLNASLVDEKSDKIYILDGSSVTVSHSARNIDEYPQYKNANGKSHFPIVRVGVAMEAHSGVALRPTFCPFNGPEAQSEIQLIAPLLPQLPEGSKAIADRYFGGFFFASEALRNKVEVVVRLRDSVFKKVLGRIPTGSGEEQVLWRPSDYDRRKYPALADHPGVSGRCVWHTFQRRGFKPMTLLLFTTTNLSLAEVVKMYGLRWNVETDLRSIKSTLKMDFIKAKSPDVVQKEIVLGFVAYNLTRQLMKIAAKKLRVPARKLSFTEALAVVNSAGQVLLKTETPQQQFNTMLTTSLTDYRGFLLPKRKKKQPSSPRTKWRRGNPKFTTNPKIPKVKGTLDVS